MMLLRKFLWYSVIVLSVTISFLFAPKPLSPSEYCGKFFDIGKHAGFVINCDSYTYVKVSTELSLLMQEKSLRQSRPLYPVMGSVMGHVLYPVLKFVDTNIYEVYFAGFVMLNFLFYLAVLYLADTLLMRYTQLNFGSRSAFLFLLISNPVTKTFFWTADKQFLVLFTPMLCIWAMLYISKEERVTMWRIFLLAAMCGLALLVYGNFVLLVACVCLLLVYYRYPVLTILFSVVLICLPTLLWIAFLKYNGVNYYNHEVAAYHQFVWIVEALRISTADLYAQMKINAGNFCDTFNRIYLFFAAAFAMAVYSIAGNKLNNGQKKVVLLCSLLLVISLTFFYLMGYYRERITYTLVAPVIICIALFFDRATVNHRRVGSALLAFSVLAWHIFILTRYGPFD